MPALGHFATLSDHLKSLESKIILHMTYVCSELGISYATIYTLLASVGFAEIIEAQQVYG